MAKKKRKLPKRILKRPTEPILMEGCLRAIPAFVARHRRDDMSKHKMTVPVAGGDLSLILSWVED